MIFNFRSNFYFFIEIYITISFHKVIFIFLQIFYLPQNCFFLKYIINSRKVFKYWTVLR